MSRVLVLSRETHLSDATRAALRAVPTPLCPFAPHLTPTVEGWGLASYDAIPDVVVAEHAEPILFAKLLSDLVRIRRAVPLHLTIVIGDVADELHKHLLAPLPLPATIIEPSAFADVLRTFSSDCHPRRGRTPTHTPAPHWRLPQPPTFVLRRWKVVPLLAAFDTAATISEAARWCGFSRPRAFAALAETARQLHLPRRWRRPRQWRDVLIAALSFPDPLERTQALPPLLRHP